MTVYLDADTLVSLVEASSVVRRSELLASLQEKPRGIEVTKTVPAAELLAIYRRRLERWRSERLPVSQGLPEFVDALIDRRSDDVVVAGHEGRTSYFVLLLRSDLGELISAIWIDRGQSDWTWDDEGGRSRALPERSPLRRRTLAGVKEGAHGGTMGSPVRDGGLGM